MLLRAILLLTNVCNIFDYQITPNFVAAKTNDDENHTKYYGLCLVYYCSEKHTYRNTKEIEVHAQREAEMSKRNAFPGRGSERPCSSSKDQARLPCFMPLTT